MAKSVKECISAAAGFKPAISGIAVSLFKITVHARFSYRNLTKKFTHLKIKSIRLQLWIPKQNVNKVVTRRHKNLDMIAVMVFSSNTLFKNTGLSKIYVMYYFCYLDDHSLIYSQESVRFVHWRFVRLAGIKMEEETFAFYDWTLLIFHSQVNHKCIFGMDIAEGQCCQ